MAKYKIVGNGWFTMNINLDREDMERIEENLSYVPETGLDGRSKETIRNEYIADIILEKYDKLMPEFLDSNIEIDFREA